LGSADGSSSGWTDVTVGSGDDDVEFGLLVSIVVGVVQRNETTPPDTLDASKRWRVRASIGIWSKGWVTLKVDVEGSTAIDAAALATARLNVVGIEEGETHVVVSGVGSKNVAEDLVVARWGHGGRGDVGVVRVVLEVLRGVWSSGVVDAGWLSDTDIVALAKSGGSGGD